MNFASWTFVLLFLPFTLGLFRLIGGPGAAPQRAMFLILMSIVFYAWSGLDNVAVLAASLALNLAAGKLLTRALRDGVRTAIMWTAVAGNVGLLLAFKIAAL